MQTTRRVSTLPWLAAVGALAGVTACTGPIEPLTPQICAIDPALNVTLPCSNEPRRIVDDPGFVTLAGGQFHTCGLTADGEAYCWGSNQFGALGTGATQRVVPRPVRVATALRFAGLTAGSQHTCGWTAEGAGYCWSSNDWVELGIGPGEPATPGPQKILGEIDFVQMSGGVRHTCGVARDGFAHCWGTDWWGQVGRGVWDMARVPTPSPVVGGLTFISVGAGRDATCALTHDGEALCWGLGESGALGTRGTGICSDLLGQRRCSPSPVRVDSPLRFSSLHTGSGHSCGLTPAGEAYCWGDSGQAPTGTAPVDPFVPSPVENHRFRLLSAGGATTCGITDAGDTLCWGFNHSGQIGSGSTSYYIERPATVLGGHRFRTLAVGQNHVCAITGAGDTFCWGRNDAGQLGIGVW
jgi:alpha-tubulin suppressor-like RCC1 family protein